VVVAAGDDAHARARRWGGGLVGTGGVEFAEGGLAAGEGFAGEAFAVGADEGASEVGDFLGAFVDEEDDDLDVGVVAEDGGGDVLEEGGLAGLGGRDDQASLPASDGAEEVDEAAGGWAAGVFEGEAGLRVDAGEVFEAFGVGRKGEGLGVDVEGGGGAGLAGRLGVGAVRGLVRGALVGLMLGGAVVGGGGVRGAGAAAAATSATASPATAAGAEASASSPSLSGVHASDSEVGATWVRA
jgi:hypothetical protein